MHGRASGNITAGETVSVTERGGELEWRVYRSKNTLQVPLSPGPGRRPSPRSEGRRSRISAVTVVRVIRLPVATGCASAARQARPSVRPPDRAQVRNSKSTLLTSGETRSDDHRTIWIRKNCEELKNLK